MTKQINKLDENTTQYRAKPGTPKHAVLRWEPADYELSWGEQHFDGPHVVVADGDGHYGVELRMFFATHRAVPSKRDHYVKDVIVWAVRVTEPTDIVTTIDGKEEARSTVQPGGWIIQNPAGELYYNTAERFAAHYEPVEALT